MEHILRDTAKRIPEGIRKIIVEKQLVEMATTVPIEDSPMEYLFDVYAEFIDVAGEFSSWQCNRCREKVLEDFKKIKPYL